MVIEKIVDGKVIKYPLPRVEDGGDGKPLRPRRKATAAPAGALVVRDATAAAPAQAPVDGLPVRDSTAPAWTSPDGFPVRAPLKMAQAGCGTLPVRKALCPSDENSGDCAASGGNLALAPEEARKKEAAVRAIESMDAMLSLFVHFGTLQERVVVTQEAVINQATANLERIVTKIEELRELLEKAAELFEKGDYAGVVSLFSGNSKK